MGYAPFQVWHFLRTGILLGHSVLQTQISRGFFLLFVCLFVDVFSWKNKTNKIYFFQEKKQYNRPQVVGDHTYTGGQV